MPESLVSLKPQSITQRLKYQEFNIFRNYGYRWEIDDLEFANELERDRFLVELDENTVGSISHCPICGEVAESIMYDGTEIGLADGDCPGDNYCLSDCTNCGFWEFNGLGAPDEYGFMSSILASSIAKSYPMELPQGCGQELAIYLIKNPLSWGSLDPKQTELLIKNIFRYNHKHTEVRHVGRPADGGVDIYFIDDEQKKWLIQVKRRENPLIPEPYSTIQSLLGSLVLHGERHGIVVSTANHYSRFAKLAASTARDQGFFVELIDVNMLSRLIESMQPRIPLGSLFSSSKAMWVSDIVKQFYYRGDCDEQQRISDYW